jgi:lysyl-tRNA synthetase class 2
VPPDSPPKSPWWHPDRHADRRPFLLARGAIQSAIRRWFESEGFTEVDPAILQVSPGNETHLHAFATELVGPDGSRRPLYLHTSPEFACKKLLAAGETRSSPSPPPSATASAAPCTIRSSPCWNGIAPTPPTSS